MGSPAQEVREVADEELLSDGPERPAAPLALPAGDVAPAMRCVSATAGRWCSASWPSAPRPLPSWSSSGRVWRRTDTPSPVAAIEDPRRADHRHECRRRADRRRRRARATGTCPPRENAMFDMLTSLSMSLFVLARSIALRAAPPAHGGPVSNLQVGRPPSITTSGDRASRSSPGGAAILTRNEDLEPWLAIPFGVGMGADARRIRAAAGVGGRLLELLGGRRRADRARLDGHARVARADAAPLPPRRGEQEVLEPGSS